MQRTKKGEPMRKKDIVIILMACIFLSGCASVFGKKEVGAKERQTQPIRGGYRSMEDLAEGSTAEERAFGVQ